MAEKLIANRKLARKAGAKRYQGMPCRHHHNGVRYTNDGKCCACGVKNREGRGELSALKSAPDAFLHRVFVLGDPDRVTQSQTSSD